MGEQQEGLDAHLSRLGGTLTRKPNRNSAGRYSVSSNDGTSSVASHQSLQNVTNTLTLTRISTEISETENTIRALEAEISNVEKRRSRALSAYGESDIGDREDDADAEFYFRHSRPRNYKPTFTLSFFFTCIVMFVVEIGVNHWSIEDLNVNPLIGPSADVLLHLGAKDTELLQAGEVWRLLAPIILHVGVVHLLINLLGLISIGLPMEQEFGTWKIATISVVSGIFGIVLSSLFAPQLIGVGASGAIFGLFGAAWADLIQNWYTYAGKNTLMLGQLAFFTVLNFVFGLMPFVDNFAHIGGFFCGLCIGMALLVKSYGDVKVNRTTQITLRVFSAIILPIFLITLMALLFFGFDVANRCKYCSYFSCVPFPPKVAADDRWWDCTPCSNGYGSFENFTSDALGSSVDILCPNGTSVPANIDGVDKQTFENNFIVYCSIACEESETYRH